MFNSLDNFKNFLKDKKIAVLGLGISNMPLVEYLAKMGYPISVFDTAEKEQLEHNILKLKNYRNID